MPAEILVVAKNQRSLFEYLRLDFAEDPDVQVVMDRRRGDRRRERQPWTDERRQAERRTRAVDEKLSSIGFAIIRSE
jgi:hypothetical protein